MGVSRRHAELADELREARNEAGFTQQQAASILKCTQSKITKIETAATEVKPNDLEKLLQLYRPAEARLSRIQELSTLSGPAISEAARRPHAAYLRMLEKEKRASVALALHSERIPCPLQSETYRFKQYYRAGDPTSQTSLLLDRDHRAAIFTAPERQSQYRVLLSESALHRLPGGRTPELVIDQAEYLLALLERHERLSLHIVPFTADIPFLDADFTVLKFPDPKDDVAYVDTNVDAQLIKGAQRVADRENYWQLVRAEALARDDTGKFLRKLIDEANAEQGR